MKICCGITLFHPDISDIKNIKILANIFEKIYIYDNSENNNEYSFQFTEKKYYYIYNKKNDGLSKALNIMCKKAINDGFEYILLLDQDSRVDIFNLKEIVNLLSKDIKKNIAIYSPKIIYNHKNNKNNETNTITSLKWAITSGSILNLEIYNRTDGFDENYFIDRLDYDYCYQLKKMGYEIIRLNNYVLYQELGYKNKIFKYQVSNHDELRHYYIFRNRLYFYRKYFHKNFFKKLELKLKNLSQIIKIMLFENNKLLKIKYIIKAKKDFLNGILGKYKNV